MNKPNVTAIQNKPLNKEAVAEVIPLHYHKGMTRAERTEFVAAINQKKRK